MKLLSLKCPNCAAPLEVNASLRSAACNFCGHSFIVDDEAARIRVEVEDPRRVGYEFERGRMDAQDGGADPELARKLKELVGPLSRLADLEPRLGELAGTAAGLRGELDAMRSPAGKKKVWLAPAIIAGGAAVLAFTRRAGMAGAMSLLPLAALLFLALSIVRRARIARLGRKLDAVEKERAGTAAEVGSIHARHDVGLVPEDYRTVKAVRFMAAALSNRRALTIQQAVNLYEEEEHKARMEALMKEQTELQRRHMRESHGSARASRDKGESIGRMVAKGMAMAAGAALLGRFLGRKR